MTFQRIRSRHSETVWPSSLNHRHYTRRYRAHSNQTCQSVSLFHHRNLLPIFGTGYKLEWKYGGITAANYHHLFNHLKALWDCTVCLFNSCSHVTRLQANSHILHWPAKQKQYHNPNVQPTLYYSRHLLLMAWPCTAWQHWGKNFFPPRHSTVPSLGTDSHTYTHTRLVSSEDILFVLHMHKYVSSSFIRTSRL